MTAPYLNYLDAWRFCTRAGLPIDRIQKQGFNRWVVVL